MLPSFTRRSTSQLAPSSPIIRNLPLALTNKRYVSLGIAITLLLFLYAWFRDSPSLSSTRLRPWKAPSPMPSTIWSRRAEAVRDAFVYAYEGYRVYAMPHDELKPMTGKFVDNFNGWGVTMYDALDTLWIMDLKDYFEEAVALVRETKFDVQPNPNAYVPFFETVIRYLGGMLSAYALSGELILLSQADKLGTILLPAFDTPSGLPKYAVHPETGMTKQGWTGAVLWAEALSNQIEYKYLAHLTGNEVYFQKSEHIMDLMLQANVTDWMFPTQWSPLTGQPKNNQFSVGAFADSAHEYLLKQWLLTAKSEPKALDLYLKEANAIINNLIYISPNRRLMYVTDTTSTWVSHTFEHLSCFLPGLFALGVHTLGEELSAQNKELHMWAAEGLAHTCWLTYADQASGLGPDEVTFMHWAEVGKGKWVTELEEWEDAGRPGAPPGVEEAEPEEVKGSRDYSNRRQSYMLRPEALESFYLMWKVTGEEKWRERSWAVFEAIERHTKTEYGFASIVDVDKEEPPLRDEMASFLLAETFKYLYLTFVEDDLLPLDKWVLNTEAHPLPVFEWTPEEKAAYDVL